MKIMTILFLTAFSVSSHATISDVEVGTRLHELFCSVPEASFEDFVLTRNPQTTAKQLQEMLEMKQSLIASLQSAGETATKFDRHSAQFVAIYKMLEDRGVSSRHYQQVRESEIGQAYIGCQLAETMRHRLMKVGCSEAGLSVRDLKPTLAACARLMMKTQALVSVAGDK